MIENLVLLGFLGSLAAGSMTTIGALPVLAGSAPSERTRDTLLGFAAGARWTTPRPSFSIVPTAA